MHAKLQTLAHPTATTKKKKTGKFSFVDTPSPLFGLTQTMSQSLKLVISGLM